MKYTVVQGHWAQTSLVSNKPWPTFVEKNKQLLASLVFKISSCPRIPFHIAVYDEKSHRKDYRSWGQWSLHCVWVRTSIQGGSGSTRQYTCFHMLWTKLTLSQNCFVFLVSYYKLVLKNLSRMSAHGFTWRKREREREKPSTNTVNCYLCFLFTNWSQLKLLQCKHMGLMCLGASLLPAEVCCRKSSRQYLSPATLLSLSSFSHLNALVSWHYTLECKWLTIVEKKFCHSLRGTFYYILDSLHVN